MWTGDQGGLHLNALGGCSQNLGGRVFQEGPELTSPHPGRMATITYQI